MPLAPKVRSTPSLTLSDYSDGFVLYPLTVKPKKKHLLSALSFPSKIGGKPAWLVPENFPRDLTCGRCGGLCSFLLQVYAPNEEISDNDFEGGFHRTLFVFVCHSCGDQFKIFRSQISRFNSFYPSAATSSGSPLLSTPAPPLADLCTRCGLPHTPATPQGCETHMYPEFLVESDEICGNLSEQAELSPEEIERELQELAKVSAAMDATEEDDMMDTAAAEGNQEIFQNFADKFPGSVGMYWRGGRAMWLLEEADESAGKCRKCGKFRQFEFQLNAGLIDKVKALENLDFAVAAFYTCGCQIGLEYVEEAVKVQVEPESWWKCGVPQSKRF